MAILFVIHFINDLEVSFKPMKQKKQLRLLFAFCALVILSWQPLQAISDEDIDLSDLDGISMDSIDQYESDHPELRARSQQISAFDLLGTLASIPKSPSPLWQNTKPPKGRDVLYLLPHKIATLEYGGLGMSLFFNMTNKMHVGAASLVDFGNINTDFVTQLVNSTLQSQDKPPLDSVGLNGVVTNLIDHFKRLNIQDRKFGSFIQGGLVRGPFSLQLQSSIHLAAKNFWLDVRSQQEMRRLFGLIDPILAQDNLSKKEFYILNYGMGDTRVKAGINSLNMTNLQLDTGFEFILPTSRLVSQPISNITLKLSEKLDPTKISAPAQEIIKSIVPNIFKIRDLLLAPELGNGGHFGIGWYTESKINLPANLAYLWGRLSYDNLIAREQKRLIMYKKTIMDLKNAKPQDPTNELEAQSLALQVIREFYLPTIFEVESHPGGIFNFAFSLNKEINKWNYCAGYDYLSQGRERIRKVYNSKIYLQNLDIAGAEAHSNSQHKIFGEIMKIKHFKKFDLDIALGGDVTAKSRNLGQDWTVYLKFASSF